MGKVKQRTLQRETAKEGRIQKAVHAVQVGEYPSLRQTAEAYDIPLTTLRRRLKGGTTRALAHADQQLLTPAEEKAIIRWIVRLEDWGFPPRIQHVKEAVALLKGKDISWTEESTIGKNWITRFLNRHPEIVSKFSSQMDKKRLKMSEPKILEDHFRKIRAIKTKHLILDDNTYNADEKGFRQGISDRAKVLVQRKERGMTAKVATDGNRELITVIECISGDGHALPPFIIYKGAGHYMGWYKHLDPSTASDFKFAYSLSGWTNRILGFEWIKHFHQHTVKQAKGGYRLLIIDGHNSHITIKFIEYCISINIIVYCLPSHSTHLLQPLDVGLFSPLQKFYGEQVDKLTRFGNVAIRKGNFLPMLVEARQRTYTKLNIAGGWRGAGLIPFNPRHVLGKLPQVKARETAAASAPPGTSKLPPTPRNTSDMHRRVRQLQMRLHSDEEVPSSDILELVDSLQRFAIAKDADLQLERHINDKWKQAQQMNAPVDRRELGTDLGVVLDGTVLHKLYQAREARAQKGGTRQPKGKAPQWQKPKTPTRVQFGSPVVIGDSEDESGLELEGWSSTDIDSDSSMGSCITVATPLRCRSPPIIVQSPLVGCSEDSSTIFSLSVMPAEGSTRVLRSRQGRK